MSDGLHTLSKSLCAYELTKMVNGPISGSRATPE